MSTKTNKIPDSNGNMTKIILYLLLLGEVHWDIQQKHKPNIITKQYRLVYMLL